MILRFVAILAIGVTLSSGIVLQCDFMNRHSYWGINYACIAKNLETTLENRTITEVKGNHIKGKTNDDVQKILIHNQNCPVLPINIGKFFKNLETFYVMESQVKILTNDDLKGLDKLRIFDVSHNPIERIENGYFEGKSTIEMLSFYKCALKFVGSSALDPLINLKEGHFQYNHCIDYQGTNKQLLPILKRNLIYCNEKDNIDLYATPPPDSDDEEKGMDFEEEGIYPEEVKKVEELQSTSTEPRPNEVHYINEYQLTFVGRNAFLIILLLLFVIIVGIMSLGWIQYSTKRRNPLIIETHRLSDDF